MFRDAEWLVSHEAATIAALPQAPDLPSMGRAVIAIVLRLSSGGRAKFPVTPVSRARPEALEGRVSESGG
jgi:hypothetical protein